jgi:predicted phage tail protein
MGITLHFGLRRKFEKKYKYSGINIPVKVKSVSEIMRCLDSQFPGFRNLIRRSGYYRIVRGNDLKNDISEDQLDMNFNEDDWHLYPIASGAGGGGGAMGWIQVVLGAILIIVGICLYYTPFGVPLIVAGAGMMLGGIATLLTPVPKEPKQPKADDPSYTFNGAINRAGTGLTCPVAYGRIWIGCIPISQGIVTEDIN